MSAPERIGEYEILGELGRGAVGVVYRARKPSLPDREVALKEVPVGDSGAERERKMREVRTLLRIHSLHIVALHDVFEAPDRGSLCIVMERLEPETLRDRITALGGNPMPLDAVAAVIDGVLDALEATHGAIDEAGHPCPIVHRDLKPENVGYQKWRGGEIVKVMDFGIARFADQDGKRIERALQTLQAYTPAYAAPEVLFGEVARPPADLWSVGLILWEICAGRHPFSDARGKVGSPVQALIEHQGVAPPLPAHVLPRVPEGVVDLLRDLCAHDPALRPTAREARERLAGALGAQLARSSPSQKITGAGVAPAGRRSRRGLVALGIVLGVLILAGVVLGAVRMLATPEIAGLPPSPGPAFIGAPLAVPPPPSSACPELDSYDPAFASLPADELERRVRAGRLIPPMAVEQMLDGIRGQIAVYRPEKRDCMYRVGLIALLVSNGTLTRTIPGGWAHDRSSAEIAALLRTVPLRQPWSLAQRNDVLAQVETTFIANLRADTDADREYWRHLYYGLVLQCEATDQVLAELHAQRRSNDCLQIRPRAF